MTEVTDHKLLPPKKGQLGVRCTCGMKFAVTKAAESHVVAANNPKQEQPMADKSQDEVQQEANAIFAGDDENTPPQYRQTADEVKTAQVTEKPVPSPEPVKSEQSKAVAAQAPPPPPAPESNGKTTVQAFMRNDMVMKRVEKMLGKRTPQFITAVIAATNNIAHLSECTPGSVLNAALTVAALDLPINNNLGFAYIIPYQNSKKVGNSWVKEYEAQFQMGWKGFIQLAQRSGQYKTIAATQVYEGQLIEADPLLGNTFDWSSKKSDKIIGYVAQFQLINGFGKDLYMTMDEVKEHANRFSQAYRSDQQYSKKSSPWSNDFDAMAQKTVLKQLVSKFGPMSIDPQMQMAVEKDQAVIGESGAPEYPDNTNEVEDAIAATETRAELSEYMSNLTVEDRKKFAPVAEARLKELAQ